MTARRLATTLVSSSSEALRGGFDDILHDLADAFVKARRATKTVMVQGCPRCLEMRPRRR